jgi:hypothetical protein
VKKTPPADSNSRAYDTNRLAVTNPSTYPLTYRDIHKKWMPIGSF